MPEDKNPNWGGARLGAGRPRKSPPQFEPDQWRLIAEALREYASMNSGDEENPFSEMADSIDKWQKVVSENQIEIDNARSELDAAMKNLDKYRKK